MKHLIFLLIFTLLFAPSLSAGGQSEKDPVVSEELPVWVASPRLAAYPAWPVRAVGVSGDFDADHEAAARAAAEKNALESLSLQLVVAVRAKTITSSSRGSSAYNKDVFFPPLNRPPTL